jgi:hypothetical protein
VLRVKLSVIGIARSRQMDITFDFLSAAALSSRIAGISVTKAIAVAMIAANKSREARVWTSPEMKEAARQQGGFFL